MKIGKTLHTKNGNLLIKELEKLSSFNISQILYKIQNLETRQLKSRIMIEYNELHKSRNNQ